MISCPRAEERVALGFAEREDALENRVDVPEEASLLESARCEVYVARDALHRAVNAI